MRCSECGVPDRHLTPDGICTTCWCKAMDERQGITRRYFVTESAGPEREVTKAEWVAVERRAGFHNTTGHPDEPGTGGFGTSGVHEISGRIEESVPTSRQERTDQ